MGLFDKKQPTQPATPASRTIPKLEPTYFETIHERLIANGGSESATEIAAGVGNAIYSTGLKFLTAIGAAKAANDFKKLYENRSPEDRDVPDRMIDFLVAFEPTVQSGEGGFVGELLSRLDDVLSRPA